MQKLYTLIFSILFFVNAFAQTPEGFKYQAVLRDNSNQSVNSKEITVVVNIIQGEVSNTPLYTESHEVITGPSGLFSLSIGRGATSDVFSDIVWSDGPYFAQIVIDGTVFSTSQLMSVPFSMHAKTAEKIESFGVSATGDTLAMNGTQYVVPGISASNTKAYKDQLVLGGSNDEKIKSCILLEDGSYWVAGTTSSNNGDVSDNHGEQDIWVVKVNADKTIAWQKCIGGSGYDNFTTLVPTEDGGCLIGGTTESSDGDITKQQGDFDILIAQLNKDGIMNWVETYGGGNTDFLNHLSLDSNGDIIVGATTFSHGGDILKNAGDADIWIFKLNETREIEWQKSIGGLQYDALKKLDVNTDGSFSLYGITESNDGSVQANNGAMDIWVAQLSSARELTAQLPLGQANNDELMVVAASGDNVLLGGINFASDWTPLNSKKSKNIVLYEINSSLSVLNNSQIGGSFSEDLINLLPLTNGQTLMVAESESNDGEVSGNNGDQDIWLALLNGSLGIETSVCLGGSYFDQVMACKPLDEGGYLLVGTSESSDGDVNSNNGLSDIWVLKLDASLNVVKSKTFGGTYAEDVLDIFPEANDKFTLVGTTASDNYGISGFHGQAGKNTDIWMLTEGF